MDFARIPRAAEDRTRWKGVVEKSLFSKLMISLSFKITTVYSLCLLIYGT